MADNYKTIGAVTVQADQFDLTTTPKLIPAACVGDADWDRLKGIGDGWKVLTDRGYAFPKSGDWIVQKNGHTFCIDNATFVLLFTVV